MDIPLTINSPGLMHITVHFAELVLMYYASSAWCCTTWLPKKPFTRAFSCVFHQWAQERERLGVPSGARRAALKQRETVCVCVCEQGQLYKVKERKVREGKTGTVSARVTERKIKNGFTLYVCIQECLRQTERESMNRRCLLIRIPYKWVCAYMTACTARACTFVNAVCMSVSSCLVNRSHPN